MLYKGHGWRFFQLSGGIITDITVVIGSCSNRIHQSRPWSELSIVIGFDSISQVACRGALVPDKWYSLWTRPVRRTVYMHDITDTYIHSEY
jgi:hypothetical protein